MSILRAPLIAAALTMVSCTAFAQQGAARIITPDSEHVYSADPRKAGELLDDEALQRENERKQRAKMEREYQRDQALRQEELDAAAARAAAATAPFYEEQPSDQVWSYGGPFGSRQFRRAFGSGRQIRAGAAPRGAPAAVSSSHHR
jgi:hypothetical protein